MNGDDDLVKLLRLLRELTGKLAWFFSLGFLVGVVGGLASAVLIFHFVPAAQELMRVSP